MVVDIRSNTVRLGVTADLSIPVHREEIWDLRRAEGAPITSSLRREQRLFAALENLVKDSNRGHLNTHSLIEADDLITELGDGYTKPTQPK